MKPLVTTDKPFIKSGLFGHGTLVGQDRQIVKHTAVNRSMSICEKIL